MSEAMADDALYAGLNATICNGSLPAGHYENVMVAEGADCIADQSGTEIDGHFVAIQANSIYLDGISVGGDIYLKDNTSSIVLYRNVVGHDLRVHKNILDPLSEFIEIGLEGDTGNQVGGDLIVDANSAWYLLTSDNTVGGKLIIKNNVANHDDYQVFCNIVGDDLVIKHNLADGDLAAIGNCPLFFGGLYGDQNGTVGGDLIFNGNTGRGGSRTLVGLGFILVEVAGDIEFKNNTILNGFPNLIGDNTAGGSITCKNNNPMQVDEVWGGFIGGDNTAGGEDKCPIED